MPQIQHCCPSLSTEQSKVEKKVREENWKQNNKSDVPLPELIQRQGPTGQFTRSLINFTINLFFDVNSQI